MNTEAHGRRMNGVVLRPLPVGTLKTELIDFVTSFGFEDIDSVKLYQKRYVVVLCVAMALKGGNNCSSSFYSPCTQTEGQSSRSSWLCEVQLKGKCNWSSS